MPRKQTKKRVARINDDDDDDGKTKTMAKKNRKRSGGRGGGAAIKKSAAAAVVAFNQKTRGSGVVAYARSGGADRVPSSAKRQETTKTRQRAEQKYDDESDDDDDDDDDEKFDLEEEERARERRQDHEEEDRARVTTQCTTLKTGDVDQLRQRVSSLAKSDRAVAAKLEAAGSSVDALTKIQLCQLLGVGGTKQSYQYSDIATEEIPSWAFDPFTQEIMIDPYLVSSGRSYEHDSAVHLLSLEHPRDPITREALDKTILIRNPALAVAIKSWAEENFGLSASQIQSESKEAEEKRVAEQAAEAAERKRMEPNKGRFRRQYVADVFTQVMAADPVFRGIQVEFVDNAYFNKTWNMFSTFLASVAAETRRKPALTALWIGAGADTDEWEVCFGDRVMLIVKTSDQLQSELELLADKGTIQEIEGSELDARARVFTADQWPQTAWENLTAAKLHALGTIRVVLKSIPSDAGRQTDVPGMLWDLAKAGQRVFFIETTPRTPGWLLRSPGKTGSTLLTETGSGRVLTDEDVLLMLQSLHDDDNLVRLLILGAPRTHHSGMQLSSS